MPGLSLTNDFMLGTATVMIGDPANLFALNASNSIGLVKNFTINTSPVYTELTQGLTNNVVHSVMTGNPVAATMEAYEYTAQNLSYALGLSGSPTVAPMTVSTTTSGTISGTSVPVTAVTGFAAGDYIMIYTGSTDEDDVIVRQVAAVVASPKALTVDVTIAGSITSGKIVKKVNMLAVGDKNTQPFFAAKVMGVLANGTKVALMIPKLRITKGFSLAFSTQQYGNLPIEFTMYDQVATDTFYGKFNYAQAALLRV